MILTRISLPGPWFGAFQVVPVQNWRLRVGVPGAILSRFFKLPKHTDCMTGRCPHHLVESVSLPEAPVRKVEQIRVSLFKDFPTLGFLGGP